MNLAQLRKAVRDQLDLDAEDLPNARLDLYIREAFQRTLERESAWPFYATEWELSTVDGKVPLPADVQNVVDVTSADGGRPFRHVGHDDARSFWGTTATGAAQAFSVWGTTLYLWPAQDMNIVVRGYRTPHEWLLNETSVPDCPEALHLPLVHYAISREYAAQEDEVLQQVYLQTWQEGVESARVQIMQPTVSRPLIFGRGVWSRNAAPSNTIVWDLP